MVVFMKRKILSLFFIVILFGCHILFANIRDFYPQSEQLIEREGYTLLYSSQNKQLRWVLEYITSETLQGNAEKPRRFKTDVLIYLPSRSVDKDYRCSGYDRGHMASLANQKWDQQLMNDTFYFSNIAPQDPQLNRKQWKALEIYIREKILYNGGEGFIITGPAFLSEISKSGQKMMCYPVIGNEVAVPTHFFKVFLYRDIEQNYNTIECWLVPNKEVSNFQNYRVSIDELEKKTHLQFPETCHLSFNSIFIKN